MKTLYRFMRQHFRWLVFWLVLTAAWMAVLVWAMDFIEPWALNLLS